MEIIKTLSFGLAVFGLALGMGSLFNGLTNDFYLLCVLGIIFIMGGSLSFCVFLSEI